jgi:hypothetical protein
VPAKVLEEMGLNNGNGQGKKNEDAPPISIEPMDHEDAA